MPSINYCLTCALRCAPSRAPLLRPFLLHPARRSLCAAASTASAAPAAPAAAHAHGDVLPLLERQDAQSAGLDALMQSSSAHAAPPAVGAAADAWGASRAGAGAGGSAPQISPISAEQALRQPVYAPDASAACASPAAASPAVEAPAGYGGASPHFFTPLPPRGLSPLERQTQLEAEQLDATVVQYRRVLTDVIRVGRGGSLPAATRLVVAWFGPLAAALAEEQARCVAASSRPSAEGRSAHARFLLLLPPEKLAVLTMHHALNAVLRGGGLCKVGGALLRGGCQGRCALRECWDLRVGPCCRARRPDPPTPRAHPPTHPTGPGPRPGAGPRR